jgi:excisionase family DNA binding protein
VKASLRELLQAGNLISADELAPALGISRVTIYSWVRRNAIPFMKIEGLVRFEPDKVAQWLKSKQIEAN